jgi:LmbE family N-acetylglucosaminyl deacetylase
MSPDDYVSADHCTTSRLVWDACFNATSHNYRTDCLKPSRVLRSLPYLYYADNLGIVDKFGKRICPAFYVDITSVIEVKEKMLAKHESQKSYLMFQHGIDDYLLTMKKWSRSRGQEVDVEFAESFRQHKGHPFPRKNILENIVPVLCSNSTHVK